VSETERCATCARIFVRIGVHTGVVHTPRSKKTRLTVPCGQGNTSKTLEIRVYVFSFAPKWYYIVVHVFTVYILRYMWVPLKGPGPVSLGFGW